MAHRSQKSSPGDSPPVDAVFREVKPTDPPPASSPGSRPVVVLAPSAVAARTRLVKRKPAVATAPERCPVCGRESELSDLSLGFMTARICPRCAAFGHLGAMLLKRMF